MRRFISLIFLVFVLSEIFGQRPSIALTFSAVNNTTWVQLDSIKVMNRTQGGDTVLYYPDTVLVLDYLVGMPELHKTVEGFQVFQNYPNPAADRTTINIYVPSKDYVSMTITDVFGRVIIRSERLLDEGLHSFRFVPGDGSLYFFTAQWRRCNSSIKILRADLYAKGACSLEHVGSELSSYQLKVAVNIQSFPFSMGDELLYICYMDTLQSGVLDSPEDNMSYTFQFATNIPCPGTPTVEYEGQIYNTIQIFSQCWLKENLNVGTMIQGGVGMSDNGLVEKYCYGNKEDTCILYGGLYSWSELMNYILLSSGQGICPEGWHVPSLMDWAILKGAADSYYRIEDTIWQSYGYQGFDVGLNLKSIEKWSFNGNGNGLYGFNLLPAGYYNPILHFAAKGQYGNYWTSDQYEEFPWKQVFDCWANDVRMLPNDDYEFLPARCIKNNP